MLTKSKQGKDGQTAHFLNSLLIRASAQNERDLENGKIEKIY